MLMELILCFFALANKKLETQGGRGGGVHEYLSG